MVEGVVSIKVLIPTLHIESDWIICSNTAWGDAYREWFRSGTLALCHFWQVFQPEALLFSWFSYFLDSHIKKACYFFLVFLLTVEVLIICALMTESDETIEWGLQHLQYLSQVRLEKSQQKINEWHPMLHNVPKMYHCNANISVVYNRLLCKEFTCYIIELSHYLSIVFHPFSPALSGHYVGPAV